ncbi:MAG: carbohydrate ABC transporter permease [Defluviitaleaceae bacterium]|nr:carbohydrate ABC transporter permease [Defluviitaleaceae bacterium]
MESRNISVFSKIAAYFVMLVFTVLTIYPIAWLITQSFKTHQQFLTTSKLSLPTEWFFGNYERVWSHWNFPNFLWNSIIYSVVSVVVIVIISNMAGFAFAKLDFKITKLLLGLFIIGLLLTIQSILIPLFLMIAAVGLFNTRLGVLIPYIGLGLPMAVYLNTDFIKKGIPDELIESAKIDGASFFRIFVSIIFPMSTPVSVTVAIITFIASWNEFILMNLLTAGDTFKAIPALVGRFAGALGSDFGMLFAMLTLSLMPILIFYFIFRNKITKGVAAGAIKG